jgi:hypothetical protein
MRPAVSILAAVLLAPVAARADNTDAARAQYERGINAQKHGKFKEAAIAFEAAYLLAPDTALLWNAAHAHRLAGNKRRALLLFRSYARQSTDNRNEAQPFIAQLKAAIEAEARQRAASGSTAPQPATPMAGTAATSAAAVTPQAATTTTTTTTATTTAPASPPATPPAAAPAPAATAEVAPTPVPPAYAPTTAATAAPDPAPVAATTPTPIQLTPTSTDPTAVATSMPVTVARKRTPRWVWGVLGFLAGAATVSAACGIALQPPTYPSPAIGSVVLR